MTTTRRIARVLVAASLITAGAFAGMGCSVYVQQPIQARQGLMNSVVVGDYLALGYQNTAFTNSVYYQGGTYGNQYYPQGYYPQTVPFVQPQYQAPAAQAIAVTPVYDGRGVTAGTAQGPVMIQRSTGMRTYSRSVCDQDPGGCDLVMTGAPGPMLPNGQQTTQAVTTLPGGYTVPTLMPR